MSIEIERKFLVSNDSFKSESFKNSSIKQGFLNSNKNRIVRVRISDTKGYLTIKGLSSEDGTTRFEWEKEIPFQEAVSLLKLCEKGVIEKTRFFVKSESHIFEIDEFTGENEGLIVAEIELKNSKESFSKPNWLGREVTGVTKYYNSEISKTPYSQWA